MRWPFVFRRRDAVEPAARAAAAPMPLTVHTGPLTLYPGVLSLPDVAGTRPLVVPRPGLVDTGAPRGRLVVFPLLRHREPVRRRAVRRGRQLPVVPTSRVERRVLPAIDHTPAEPEPLVVAEDSPTVVPEFAPEVVGSWDSGDGLAELKAVLEAARRQVRSAEAGPVSPRPVSDGHVAARRLSLGESRRRGISTRRPPSEPQPTPPTEVPPTGVGDPEIGHVATERAETGAAAIGVAAAGGIEAVPVQARPAQVRPAQARPAESPPAQMPPTRPEVADTGAVEPAAVPAGELPTGTGPAAVSEPRAVVGPNGLPPLLVGETVPLDAVLDEPVPTRAVPDWPSPVEPMPIEPEAVTAPNGAGPAAIEQMPTGPDRAQQTRRLGLGPPLNRPQTTRIPAPTEYPPASSAIPTSARPDTVYRAEQVPVEQVRREEVPVELARAVGAAHGVDVSDTPVFRGPGVTDRARVLGAHAFTSAGEVYLPDETGPLTDREAGAVLVHELTHVAQQQALGADLPAESTVAGQALEHEALATERWFLDGATGPPLIHPPAAGVLAVRPARQTSPDLVQRRTDGGTSWTAPQEALDFFGTRTAASTEPVTVDSPPFDPPSGSTWSGPTPEQPPNGGGFTELEQFLDSRAGESEVLRERRPEPTADRELDACRDRLVELCAQRPVNLDSVLDMDELATKVYHRVRGLLRWELIVDRERSGLLADFR